MPKKNKIQKELSFKNGENAITEYRKKRHLNNLAVQRSRVRSTQRVQQTVNLIKQLGYENCVLEEKLKILHVHLRLLLDLFLAHSESMELQPKSQI